HFRRSIGVSSPKRGRRLAAWRSGSSTEGPFDQKGRLVGGPPSPGGSRGAGRSHERTEGCRGGRHARIGAYAVAARYVRGRLRRNACAPCTSASGSWVLSHAAHDDDRGYP